MIEITSSDFIGIGIAFFIFLVSFILYLTGKDAPKIIRDIPPNLKVINDCKKFAMLLKKCSYIVFTLLIIQILIIILLFAIDFSSKFSLIVAINILAIFFMMRGFSYWLNSIAVFQQTKMMSKNNLKMK